jgi:ribosomal protein S14
MEIPNKSLDQSMQIQSSLRAMKKVKGKMNAVVDLPTTPRALTERIKLCKHLLREIANVQTSLALHLQHSRAEHVEAPSIAANA